MRKRCGCVNAVDLGEKVKNEWNKDVHEFTVMFAMEIDAKWASLTFI